MKTIWIAVLVVVALAAATFVMTGATAPTDGNTEDVQMSEADEMQMGDTHDADHDMDVNGDGHISAEETGMDMEEHKKLMDDGKTFMAMAGAISPETLFVSPGQELRFANHENFALELKTADGKYTTGVSEPDSEHSSFMAPMQPGRYEYVSSHDPKVMGVIVVETP